MAPEHQGCWAEKEARVRLCDRISSRQKEFQGKKRAPVRGTIAQKSPPMPPGAAPGRAKIGVSPESSECSVAAAAEAAVAALKQDQEAAAKRKAVEKRKSLAPGRVSKPPEQRVSTQGADSPKKIALKSRISSSTPLKLATGVKLPGQDHWSPGSDGRRSPPSSAGNAGSPPMSDRSSRGSQASPGASQGSDPRKRSVANLQGQHHKKYSLRSHPAEAAESQEVKAPKASKVAKFSKVKAVQEEEEHNAKKAEKKEAKEAKEAEVEGASNSEDAEGSRKRRRAGAEVQDSSKQPETLDHADVEATESGKSPAATEVEATASLEQRLPATPQRRRSNSARSGEGEGEPANNGEDSKGADVPSPRAAPSSPTSVKRNATEESCSICCEDVVEGDAVKMPCGHGWYCRSCVKRHAEARLEIGSVDVCCPECNGALAERTLRRVLPENLVELLLARSLEQAVSAAGDLYACPTPNCSFRVALEDGDVSRLKCPECKKTCCLRCGAQPYHRGLSCQEYAEKLAAKGKNTGEEELQKWMEETGSKRCPTCSVIVTKENLEKQNSQYVECHKMQCRNCDTRFCFKCLAVLTEKYSCGCTRKEHGFINPKTGRRNNHLKVKAAAKGKARK